MAFVNLPPNLQDIFYSITDRVSKLETGPNQAMYTAEAAQGTASNASAQAANASAQALIAQTQATQALTQAQAAYVLGSQALIKDANTITNSSNNLTGINANGITVYSGGSATTGARVVMNSAGIAGYNSGGTATFSLLSSTGAFSTSGAIFTSSTISGGSLNINGNAVIDSSGFLTAQGATLKGTVNATAGYFGSPTNGWSIDTTGLIGVGTGYISGGAINGSTVTGGTIQTSTGTSAVILNGSSNALQFKAATGGAGSIVGNMLPLNIGGTVYGVLMHSGATPDSSGNTYPQSYVGTGSARMAYDANTYVSCSVSGTTLGSTIAITLANNATASGSFTTNGELFAAGHSTTANAANGYVFATGGRIARSTASSERYKENITDLRDVPELNPKKLLDIPVRAFSYKTDYLKNDDRTGVLVPGLIAEEVDAIYPLAADYADGNVENINDRALLVNLLALVQDLYKEIEILKTTN